jgi:hypothetical protein
MKDSNGTGILIRSNYGNPRLANSKLKHRRAASDLAKNLSKVDNSPGLKGFLCDN